MIGALLSFWSALEIRDAARLSLDLAVVLGVMLGRTQQGNDLTNRAIGLVLLPVAAMAASYIGALMENRATIAETLFVVAIGGAIWIRRFGSRFTKAGTLFTLPFIATLVTPIPQPATAGYLLWSALIAIVAFGWVSVLQAVADPAGFAGGTPPAPATASAVKTARRGLARLPASTRMAVQMAVALTAAFAVGRVVFPAHWVWPVLTAFIVCSGNRGRADVVYKGALRMIGALIGTVLASVLFVGVFSPGADASIVAIFVILMVATWLRPFNYAYWAGCVTAALAFLYGYFGQTGTGLLYTRLEGILYGALIAVAASWFILPVGTADVLRRRRARHHPLVNPQTRPLGSEQ